MKTPVSVATAFTLALFVTSPAQALMMEVTQKYAFHFEQHPYSLVQVAQTFQEQYFFDQFDLVGSTLLGAQLSFDSERHAGFTAGFVQSYTDGTGEFIGKVQSGYAYGLYSNLVDPSERFEETLSFSNECSGDNTGPDPFGTFYGVGRASCAVPFTGLADKNYYRALTDAQLGGLFDLTGSGQFTVTLDFLADKLFTNGTYNAALMGGSSAQRFAFWAGDLSLRYLISCDPEDCPHETQGDTNGSRTIAFVKDVDDIPEPASLSLFVLGLAGLMYRRSKRT